MSDDAAAAGGGAAAWRRHASRLAAIPPAVLYLIVAVPSLAMMLVLTPLGSVADETAHFVHIAALAEGHVVGWRGTMTTPGGSQFAVTGIDADKAVARALDWRAGGSVRWTPDDRFFAELGNIGTYLPVFYAPGALGYGIAKVAGASPVETAQAARLVSTLAFLLLGVLALRIAVRGHAVLMATLSVPMTLSLGASLNQDGLFIATAALGAACMTRVIAARAEDRTDITALLGAMVCVALLALVKLPYFPLAAILLLPFGAGTGIVPLRELVGRAGQALIVVVPGAAWAAYSVARIALPYPRPPYEAGPLWPGPRPAPFTSTDPKAQMQVLLNPPTRIVTLPFFYLLTPIIALGLMVSGIGILGSLDVTLPRWLYLLWIAPVAGIAWLWLRPAPQGLRGMARAGLWLDLAVLLAAIVASVFAIVLSQYLTWTNVGDALIQGPQGRYFLPLLAFLCLLPSRDPRSRVPTAESLAWLPALVALIGIVPVALSLAAVFHP